MDSICKGSYFLGSNCGRCSRCRDERAEIMAKTGESKRLLEAAYHALRSFQFGNAATDLAKDMADSIDTFLSTGEPQTLVGKQEKAAR